MSTTTSAPIESLNTDLLQHVLKFLCGSFEPPSYPSLRSQPYSPWASTLLACGRVNRFFHEAVSDDKLWGHWSARRVVGTGADEDGTKEEHYQVVEYGPDCEYYDARFTGWKDLTLTHAMLERVRHYQRGHGGSSCYDNNGVSLPLVDEPDKQVLGRMVQRIYPAGCHYPLEEVIALDDDSLDMLHVLVSEYLRVVLKGANRVITEYHEWSKDVATEYPILKKSSIKLAEDVLGDSFRPGRWPMGQLSMDMNRYYEALVVNPTNIPPRFVSHLSDPLTVEEGCKLNHMIRKIACKAGVVKLDNDAFEYAKGLFCFRLGRIVVGAVEEAQYIKQTRHHHTFRITPSQLERASLRLYQEGENVLRKVFLDNDDELDEEAEDEVQKPELVDELSKAIQRLEHLKLLVSKNGKLDCKALNKSISSLTEICIREAASQFSISEDVSMAPSDYESFDEAEEDNDP